MAMVLFVPLLLLALYLITVNGEDYETAKKFVAQDAHIAATTGKVRRVGFKFWSGFESVGGNGGHASYSFNAASDKGEFLVEVRLGHVAGAWRVEAADIRGQDGTLTHVVTN
ncbi:hypothetical protein V4890_21730 [Ralstonia solanacearum species complex bacterium KE056]|uniref:hypothetical protein n=1 Tax=Ralstonia solanacearum species complex bacterium KE056 TaxID=3119585 RepID=UPI002FC3BE86